VKFNDWSVVKLIEQFDPEDESCVSQPYAYVADYMIPVTLSASISDEMLAYEEKVRAEQELLGPSPAAGQRRESIAGNNDLGMSERDLKRKSRRLGWFEKLRDELAKGMEIGWFVVVCGDEERSVPDAVSGYFDGVEEEDEEEEEAEIVMRPKTPRSGSLKGFFSRKDRRPSRSSENR
jgi:hypothetical protein